MRPRSRAPARDWVGCCLRQRELERCALPGGRDDLESPTQSLQAFLDAEETETLWPCPARNLLDNKSNPVVSEKAVHHCQELAGLVVEFMGNPAALGFLGFQELAREGLQPRLPGLHFGIELKRGSCP
jgi:hypothetical protein